MNAGMRVVLEKEVPVVKELAIAFGGMGPVTVMARNTMEAAVGK